MNQARDALVAGKVIEITDDSMKIDIIRTVNSAPAASPFVLNQAAFKERMGKQ